MFFDDLPVGFRFETASRTLSEDEVIDFARAYDPQPFHTDRVAAAQSHFTSTRKRPGRRSMAASSPAAFRP